MIRIIRAVLLTSLPLTMLAGETLCQGTRSYTYDDQGNRTMVTNLVRLTSSAAFSIQPRRAVSGDRVNIFGRNFPAGDTNAVSVSFDSIPATVLSVSGRVITVDMPAGATRGVVEVSLNGGPAMVVGTIRAEGVMVSPTPIDVDYGEVVQLTANVVGASSSTVQWDVNGIPGGNADVGTITAGGLYTAPQGPSGEEFPFLISATSLEIGSTGYALVTLSCNLIGPLENRSLVSGSLTTPFERQCYEFTGEVLQLAYIAYVSDTNAHSLKLRSPEGAVLAS